MPEVALSGLVQHWVRGGGRISVIFKQVNYFFGGLFMRIYWVSIINVTDCSIFSEIKVIKWEKRSTFIFFSKKYVTAAKNADICKKNYVFKFFALKFPFILVYLSSTFQCINTCGSEDTKIIVPSNMTFSSNNYGGQKWTKKNRVKRFMRSV